MSSHLEPVKGSGALWFMGIIMLLSSVILLVAQSCSNSSNSRPNSFGGNSMSSPSANLHWRSSSEIVEGVSNSPYDHGKIKEAGAFMYQPDFLISFETYGLNDGERTVCKYTWNMADPDQKDHGFYRKTIGPPDSGTFTNWREEGPNSFFFDQTDATGRRFSMHLWAE